MKKFLLIIFGMCCLQHLSAQDRIAINGKTQGDNLFSVEGFSYFDKMSEYQKTHFKITNKTATKQVIQFKVAITYTCNRVQTNTIKYYIQPKETIKTDQWMMETVDKNCIQKGVDGVRSTIVGVDYLITLSK